MAKLSRRLDRGPLGTSRDRNPDIALDERIETVRCRIDLRGASPEAIVQDAARARTRIPSLVNARYLGVSVGYHYFASTVEDHYFASKVEEAKRHPSDSASAPAEQRPSDSSAAPAEQHPSDSAAAPAEQHPSGRRNPKWSHEELILALDLYLREGLLDDRDPRVMELSELLNGLPLHADRPDAKSFRNPNGVALKLANFAALDPSYEGKGMSRGGRRDAEVWELYAGDERSLREAAARIRTGDVHGSIHSQGQGNAPAVATVPIESLNVDRFSIEHHARTIAAERKEQQLVFELRAHLEGQGHSVVRHKYTVEGLNLYCDLFDETAAVLYEAKGDVTRESLRMALGQLLDYARFYKTPPCLAVLLPRRPSDDMLRYMAIMRVTVVFKAPDNAWQQILPAPFSR